MPTSSFPQNFPQVKHPWYVQGEEAGPDLVWFAEGGDGTLSMTKKLEPVKKKFGSAVVPFGVKEPQRVGALRVKVGSA